MRLRSITVILIGTVLAGCAGPPPAATPASPRVASSALPGRADPVALVGLWKVSASGEASGAVLRMDGEQQIMLFRRCIALTGGWQANRDGQFLAGFDSYSPDTQGPACTGVEEPADGPDFTPEWLARATGFQAEGTDLLLLDPSGAAVARLSPGAKPVTRADMAAELTGVPQVTAETRQRFDVVAAPLPAGLTPATTATLLGRWQPDGGDVGAYVEFQDDGQWRGSDGCNGQGGRWSAGPDGSFLAVAGPSTLIGCANVPVAGWMGEARRAGFDGTTLVLLDGAGKDLGRLTKPR